MMSKFVDDINIRGLVTLKQKGYLSTSCALKLEQFYKKTKTSLAGLIIS